MRLPIDPANETVEKKHRGVDRREFLKYCSAAAAVSAAGFGPGFQPGMAQAATAKSTQKTIDFHAHILNQEIWDHTASRNVLYAFGKNMFTIPEDSPTYKNETSKCLFADQAVAEMNRRKIDMHVIASSTVMQGSQGFPANEDHRLCRKMNDYTYNSWVKRYPERFIGTMVLPFQDLKLALPEMERCRADYGFKVVHAPARIKDDYLSSPKFSDYWKRADEYGIITFIHPDGVTDPWFQQYSLWNSIGQPIEEVKVISTLIYEGILDKYPNAPIIMAHGGGYLPLYMGRLDRNAVHKPFTTKNIKGIPSDYLTRLKYDLCVYDPKTLQAMYELLGADCLMLGSDFPFGDKTPYFLLDQVKGLSAADRDKIIGGNAQALLKI